MGSVKQHCYDICGASTCTRVLLMVNYHCMHWGLRYNYEEYQEDMNVQKVHKSPFLTSCCFFSMEKITSNSARNDSGATEQKFVNLKYYNYK